MAFIGNAPISVAFLVDTFSGTGSQTAYTMTVAPANTSSIIVAITGVLQDPSTYSVSGTTLTFSAAPPSGTSNISVRYLGIPASGVTTTAYRTVTDFTATAAQTSFSVPSYTVGYIDVYRNGVRLVSTDFTATTGTTVVLANACTSGDSVVTESFYVSSVLNAIPATAGSVSDSYIVSMSSSKLTGTQTVPRGTLPTGSVLQVVNTFKSDTTSATSAATLDTWVDITGMSVTITPSASTSKILILYTLNINAASGESVAVQFLRGSTAVGNGDAASNRLVCFADTRMAQTAGQFEMGIYSGTYLDSPSTTSSTTYKIQWRKPYDNGNTAIYLNRSYDDSDNNDRPRGSSSITVMEIAA